MQGRHTCWGDLFPERLLGLESANGPAIASRSQDPGPRDACKLPTLRAFRFLGGQVHRHRGRDQINHRRERERWPEMYQTRPARRYSWWKDQSIRPQPGRGHLGSVVGPAAFSAAR